jgi:hypothetical protein
MDIVCFRNICVNTPHKADDDDNNNNNSIFIPRISWSSVGFVRRIHKQLISFANIELTRLKLRLLLTTEKKTFTLGMNTQKL